MQINAIRMVLPVTLGYSSDTLRRFTFFALTHKPPKLVEAGEMTTHSIPILATSLDTTPVGFVRANPASTLLRYPLGQRSSQRDCMRTVEQQIHPYGG